MPKTSLIIATRESPLALAQANWVKEELLKHDKGLKVELLGMTTSADKMLDIPLTTVGGKGLFVKELEEALLDGRADIAVHSMKDVPLQLPEKLHLPVMCERADPRDVWVSNDFPTIQSLPRGGIVGTSSLRRQSQLAALRPDLKIVNLRGNVNTRLAYLDQGKFSAIILAAAGLERLDLSSRISDFISLTDMLPAAGQGALGIECRKDDKETLALIEKLNDPDTNRCVTAERAVCRTLGGGCQSPLAAYAEMMGDEIYIRAQLADLDGETVLHAEETGSDPENVGVAVAEDLISQGAKEILHAIYQS